MTKIYVRRAALTCVIRYVGSEIKSTATTSFVSQLICFADFSEVSTIHMLYKDGNSVVIKSTSVCCVAKRYASNLM